MPVIGEVRPSPCRRSARQPPAASPSLAGRHPAARPRIEVFYGLTAMIAEAARPERWPPIAYTNAVTQPLRELRHPHGLRPGRTPLVTTAPIPGRGDLARRDRRGRPYGANRGARARRRDGAIPSAHLRVAQRPRFPLVLPRAARPDGRDEHADARARLPRVRAHRQLRSPRPDRAGERHSDARALAVRRGHRGPVPEEARATGGPGGERAHRAVRRAAPRRRPADVPVPAGSRRGTGRGDGADDAVEAVDPARGGRHGTADERRLAAGGRA